MIRMIRRPLILLLLTPALAHAQLTRNRVEHLADSVAAAAIPARQIPGAAIAVMHRDSLIFAKGYGVTDLNTRKPITPQTIFQIASTTKPFTAIVVLQLVQEGKLALKEPVRRYLPWLAEKYSRVTIEQLLNHTSGIRFDLRRENVDEFGENEFKRRLDAADTAFSPGARWQYNNTGYTLLALAAETVTGKEFGQLLRERISGPLGMRDTGYRVAQKKDGRHAVGYDLVNNALEEAPHVFSGWGNSGVESTVLDLAKWVRALHTDKLLPRETLQRMEQPGTLANGNAIRFDFAGAPSSYGMGWFLTRFRDRALVTHGGAVAGFNAAVNRFDTLTIIVLSNGKQGADRRGQANFLADALFDALIGFVPLSSRVLPRDQEIRLAESAAPASIAADAAVYAYTSSGYVNVREGKNGFTCLVNRHSFLDGYEVLKPTCWDAEGTSTIVPQILYIGKRKAAGATADAVRAELEKMFNENQLRFPTGPGLAYMLNGDISQYDTTTAQVIQRAFPPHLMLYANGAQQAKLGLTVQAAMSDVRAPLIYAPNPRFAYIVVRVPE